MKKNSFPFKMKPFFLLALLLASLVGVLPVAGQVRGDCEYIVVDRRHKLYSEKFDPAAIQDQIYSLQRQGYTEEKAKGILGEQHARYVVENNLIKGQRYMSIFTWFKSLGCDIDPWFRSAADQGIDDIFIAVADDGTRDERFAPVFHEAKFDQNCRLVLKATKHLCQQLSFKWLTENSKRMRERIVRGAEVCLNGINKMRITACESCRDKFLQEAEWLRSSLAAGRFSRMASVLCGDGMLTVYPVNAAQ